MWGERASHRTRNECASLVRPAHPPPLQKRDLPSPPLRLNSLAIPLHTSLSFALFSFYFLLSCGTVLVLSFAEIPSIYCLSTHLIFPKLIVPRPV